MKHVTRDILITIGLIIILIILWNPYDIYMTFMQTSMLVTLLILLFVATSIFLFKEKPADEREEAHLYVASRSSYFVGTAILLTGIIIQVFDHAVDEWLVFALIGTIVAKFVALKYSQKNK